VAYSDKTSRSGSGYSGGKAVSYGKKNAKGKKDDKGIGDFLGNVGSDLKDIAVGSAVGAAKITQAVASDAAKGKGLAGVLAMAGPQAIITLPGRQLVQGDVWKGGRSELDKIAEPLIKGSAESIKKTATDPQYWYDHPVDAASNLLLFTGGVAGGVSRASNAAKAAKSGGSVSKALLAPARETRRVRYIDPVTGDVKASVVRGSYSKSAQSRAVQKAVDKVREKGAAKPKANTRLSNTRVSALNRNNKQFAKANQRIQRIEFDLANIPANQLKALDARTAMGMGKSKVSDAQWVAVRTVMEQTHPDLYIKKFRESLAEIQGKPGKAAQVNELRRQIRTYEQSKRYVNPDPVDATIPVLADARLQKLLDKGVETANAATERMVSEGWLDPTQALNRESAVGRILRGAEYVDEKYAKLALDEARAVVAAGDTSQEALGAVAAAEKMWNQRGSLVGAESAPMALARVPFKLSGRDQFLENLKNMGGGGMVGNTQTPGRLKKFSGGILEKGGGTNRVGKIIAQDAIEANRFTVSERARQVARQIGSPDPKDFPEGTKLVGVRMGPRKLTPEESDRVKNIIAGYSEKPTLTRAEEAEIRRLEKADFDDLFVETQVYQPIEGINWVPKNALGSLTRAPAAAIESEGIRAFVGAIDTLNNAQKFAVLYAKLGYIAPNLIGNAALNLVQQGPFMARNLTATFKIAKSDPELFAAIKTAMGEGLFGSTFGGLGPVKVTSAAVNAGSRLFGKITDTPFRVSSFVHEAAARGIKSRADLNKLFKDPAMRDKLYEIVIEANNDIIDYSRLGQIEQRWIRRMVFFYPWVKGSTRYAGRFVKEHPGQQAFLNHLGNFGSEYQRQVLGDLPSFAEGLVPVSDKPSAFPRVFDVAGVTPFSTPFDTGRDLARFVQGDASGLVSALTPAVGAINTVANGTNRLGYNPRDEGNFETALGDQYKNIPLKLFIERMFADGPSGGLYQRSKRDALMNILIGGPATKTADKAKLNQYAREGR